MRKYTPVSHNISGVFVFLLLGVFAVFSTAMVLLSANIYKGTVDRLAAHNGMRIAPVYVRSMLRADDETGSISVREEAGVTAVTMYNNYDGDEYLTRIYCYEGTLREWFSDADREFVPDEGEIVCLCDGLAAGMDSGLLTVNLLSGDTWTRVDIALRAYR
ncbi:MAG: DUF4860 domain-containing protein [Clostridia bacterium]|nr:DUF4860 domain-containing protein [Clostridia bacterium]